MKNKFIKLSALIVVFVFLFSFISCSAVSKAKSVVEIAKANATAETLSESATISVIDTIPNSYVNDDAGIFAKEDIEKINQLIADLEKQTTAEIGVATIKSLNEKTIEEYANNLFESWGIGKKEVNNGVLFLIAIDDKQCRIEVGYGLENVITDVIAKHIIDEIAIPSFKKGEFSTGTYEVVKKLSDDIIAANK